MMQVMYVLHKYFSNDDFIKIHTPYPLFKLMLHSVPGVNFINKFAAMSQENTEETNPWKTLSSKLVYDNRWLSLTEHQVINPGGGEGIYGEVHFKNYAIGIVALDR